MNVKSLKLVAATMAGGAIVAAAAVIAISGNTGPQAVASGSGDSATGTDYVQPSQPAMSFPSTTTFAAATGNNAAPTTLAVASASPSMPAFG